MKDNKESTYDFNHFLRNLTVQSLSDFGKMTNTSQTMTLNHRFNQNLSLSVVQRYVRSQFNFTDHFVSGVIRKDSVSRSHSFWDYDQFNAQTTAYLNYKVATGKIQHTILTGVDFNRFGWYKNDYRKPSTNRIAIFQPNYTNDV